jgi:hypothetical protein
MHGLDFDVVGGLEFFNTHGTEITPGSNVVGEDLKNFWFGHGIVAFG